MIETLTSPMTEEQKERHLAHIEELRSQYKGQTRFVNKEPISGYFLNPLKKSDIEEIDLRKISHIRYLLQLFPRTNFAIIPLPTEGTKEHDFLANYKLAESRKEFGLIAKTIADVSEIGKGKAIEAATKKADEEIAEQEKIADIAREAMKAAMLAQEFEAIKDLSPTLTHANDKIEALKVGLETTIKKIKESKKSHSNGGGDRTNPLPPIEDTNWIMRGNGNEKAEAVLMVKTDVLKGTGKKRDDPFKPGLWQAFRKEKGEGKNFSNWGSLGKVDGLAYSSLNLACNNRVQGNNGTSIGVAGLSTIELDEVTEILKQAGFELA